MSPALATSNPHRGLQAEYAARTDRGLRRRRNEDAVLVDTELRIAMVADGVGGLLYGDKAARLALDELHQYVAEPPFALCDELLMGAGILSANRKVFDWGIEQTNTGGMAATTLVALQVSEHQREVTVGHVGDSRCYRMRADELELLTRDHTLENERINLGLEPSGSPFGRNMLVRSIGRGVDVEPDVRKFDCLPDDLFILCSDGLWALVSDDELAIILQSASSLERACDMLIAAANAAGGTDNISVAMVRLSSPAARASEVRRKDGPSKFDDEDDGLELDWLR